MIGNENILDKTKLRELAAASTRVNGWYAHSEEVRGPFCRWFTCSEVNPAYKKNVASRADDCAFAAAAMNNLVALLDEIDRLEAKVSQLEDDTLNMSQELL